MPGRLISSPPTHTHTHQSILHLRFKTLIEMIFKLLSADSVFDSKRSQDVSKHEESSAPISIHATPVKKPKRTKLKGEDLRRKVCAGTEKRVLMIPTAAQLAAKRQMREQFTKAPKARAQGGLARRERVEYGSRMPRRCPKCPTPLRMQVVDAIKVAETRIQAEDLRFGDMERWWVEEDRTVRLAKAVSSSLHHA